MSAFQIDTIILSILTILVIPMIGLLWRIATFRAKITDDIEDIGKDIRALVSDKDRVHKELADQMREDRRATNERLRWLEENLWRAIGGTQPRKQ